MIEEGGRDAARGLRAIVGDDDATVRLATLLAVAAVAVRIVFWAYTHRVWEDALITALHSENAGRGLGLTHVRLGEPRIHGFTSPISVLVPLAADWFHPGWGLILIRLVSLVAAAGSVILTFGVNRVYPSLRLPLPLIGAAAGYVAIEHHQLLWGMAGMETQLVVFTLLFAFYAIALPGRPVLKGVALALCLYARPDFAPLVLILAGVLLVRALRTGERRTLVTAGVVAFLLYAVWIVFTTAYYGSPVPNTILAKGGGYTLWTTQPQSAGTFAAKAVWVAVHNLYGGLTPAFAGHGTGYLSLLPLDEPFDWLPSLFSLVLIGAGLVVAVRRRQADLTPIYAFFLLYTGYYVFLVPTIYGWYTVPMAAIAVLLIAKGARDVLAPLADRSLYRPLTWAIAALYVAAFAAVLPLTFRTERQIQTLVEDQGRKQIGLYLRGKNDPTLTVVGEPLGYVAYYSGLTYWDFPGLASRRVVQFVKAHPGTTVETLAKGLRPDYIVFRATEYSQAATAPGGEWVTRDYVIERRFVTPAQDQRQIMFIDRNIDTDFLLLRRRIRVPVQPLPSA